MDFKNQTKTIFNITYDKKYISLNNLASKGYFIEKDQVSGARFGICSAYNRKIEIHRHDVELFTKVSGLALTGVYFDSKSEENCAKVNEIAILELKNILNNQDLHS